VPQPAPEPAPEPVAATPAPAPEPEPVATTPAPEPEPDPAPVAQASYTSPPGAIEDSTHVTTSARALPSDIRDLPPLRGSDRVRHGLEYLRINVLRADSETTPYPHAIINLHKVFVGDVIPGTGARLAGVAEHGIALEVDASGERFYVRR